MNSRRLMGLSLQTKLRVSPIVHHNKFDAKMQDVRAFLRVPPEALARWEARGLVPAAANVRHQSHAFVQVRRTGHRVAPAQHSASFMWG
jgi:hypothetical protein